MADKVDFKRSLDAYQASRGEFRVVEVPDLQYLVVDGHGDPNGDAFVAAVESLYPVAYRLKFTSKAELGRDYVVMPLEGLWWADDMASYTGARDKSRWRWTLMIMTPEWIGADMVEAAVEQVRVKFPRPRLDDLRLETLTEGRCVQTLHVGSFDDEGPVLAELHDDVIPGLGLRMAGTHHEIYLSDVRKTAPERLRTILRQPVVEA